MYTEDDKYTRHKFKNNVFDSNLKKTNDNRNSVNVKNYNTNNRAYDRDFYKDYLDNDDDDEIVDYTYDKNMLSKKKYFVIIIILAIVLAILIILLIKNINANTPPVGSNGNYVRLQYEQLELKIGDSKKLEITLSTTNKNYKIEWFSNNDNVVTVDKNGNILAVNEGEAIILVAYYLEDKVYDAQCRVSVLK